VVVLAITDTHVVYHDPAGRPSQVMTVTDFDRAWSGSSRWALLVLPRDGANAPQPSVSSPTAPPSVPAACRQELTQAASAAGQQDFDRAEHLIAAARVVCPSDAAPLRELAGLRLLQRRTADAVPLARAAVAQDAADRHAWRVLGTAEFLERDQAAALDAWNRIGEPVTDLVSVEGLARTRHRVVTDRMGLRPGTLLTAADLGRAHRRLSELPAASISRVDVAPVGGGLVEIDAAVLERPLTPTAPLALGALGLRALTNREATWRLASPTGAGERLDVSARWWEARPAGAVALSLPVKSRFVSGLLRFEGGFARESYRSETSSVVPAVDDRRSALVGLSDWATATLRWDVTTRVDRWTDSPAALGVGGALERHVGDAAAVRLQGDIWPGSGFGTASLGVRWRWTHDDVDQIMASATASVASRDAPRSLWSGAGTGHARRLLLRAHPLLEDGVIVGDVFGPRLVHAGIEWRRGVASLGPLTLQLAAFGDVARATHPDLSSSAHLDVGLGVRLRIPGEGTMRLDFARGLDDGRQAVSVGWELPWPAWP
jgi:hypothetical protein